MNEVKSQANTLVSHSTVVDENKVRKEQQTRGRRNDSGRVQVEPWEHAIAEREQPSNNQPDDQMDHSKYEEHSVVASDVLLATIAVGEGH
jgi:hypothetical protein